MRYILAILAVAAIALAGCLPGGTTNLSGQVIIEDAPGSPPTCATSTAAGELCVEGDVEANGNLDIAGTSTLTGAVTASSTLAVTGAATITGAINGAILKTDEVAISLAEMTGLRATNKTLVAAQGANTVIVPVSVLFFLDYGSAAFTETTDNLALNYVGAAGDVACTAFETTASWLVASEDGYGFYTCDSNILSTTAQVVNTALTLDNNGDGEFGGGTGSTVTAWITYYVIDVT